MISFVLVSLALVALSLASTDKQFVLFKLRKLDSSSGTGSVLLEVDPSLAPIGAARFLELVSVG